MYRHQTLVTQIKIASGFSACVTRALKPHSKLKTCGVKESVIACRNNELHAYFTKRLWDGKRRLKATSAVVGPSIGSTLRDGRLSVSKPNGSFVLDSVIRLNGGSCGASLFLRNVSFLRVPCRTLRTKGRKGMEGAQKDSSFFKWMRNKLYEASLAVANFTAPSNVVPFVQNTPSRWVTACHESGHVLVAHYTQAARPALKVTIIPTKTSLGHTEFMHYSGHFTKEHVMAMLDVALGGRAAEEVIFGPGKVTPFSHNDLVNATGIVTSIVKKWGLSEKFGLQSLDTEITPANTELANKEIQRVLQEAYERAKKICREHQSELRVLAEALMKYETLNGDEIKIVIVRAILQGRL